jgi:hypothetical protein
MNSQLIESELHFLTQLKELATQHLFEASIRSALFPKDFDIVKATTTLERIINAEIDYLQKEPDDYLDIYG